MSEETILYQMTDGIAEIRFNRPHRLNAVTQQLYDELNAALGRAEADPDVPTRLNIRLTYRVLASLAVGTVDYPLDLTPAELIQGPATGGAP